MFCFFVKQIIVNAVAVFLHLFKFASVDAVRGILLRTRLRRTRWLFAACSR